MRMFKVSETKYINLNMVTRISKTCRVPGCIAVEFSGAEQPMYCYYTDDLWNRLVKAMEAE